MPSIRQKKGSAPFPGWISWYQSERMRMFVGLTLLIPLIAFWYFATKLWVSDGPKVPLTFVTMWLIAFFALPMLAFVAVECILTVVLLIIERYKSVV
jgi:hypothetical protein